MSFKQITVDDLILVDHNGQVVEGTWPVNRAAFAIHAGIHAARPDVVAAAHSHSKFGRAYATLGRTLEPLTQDSCIFYEDHVLFDDYTGVVNDPEEGKRIAHALGAHKAAILRNHGILTVGQSIEEAVFWYVTLERTCEVELLARAAGRRSTIAPDVARDTAALVGGHAAGWFSGQPLFFDWIAEVEPDAFGDRAASVDQTDQPATFDRFMVATVPDGVLPRAVSAAKATTRRTWCARGLDAGEAATGGRVGASLVIS